MTYRDLGILGGLLLVAIMFAMLLVWIERSKQKRRRKELLKKFDVFV